MPCPQSPYKDYRYEERRVGSSVEFTVTSLPKTPAKISTTYATCLLTKVVMVLLMLSATSIWLQEHKPSYQFACDSTLSTIARIFPQFLVNMLRTKTPTIALLALWMLTVMVLMRRPYKIESLFVVHGIGLQVYTSGNYYFMGQTTFLNLDSIIDLVIHEGFKGLEVIFFMAILVKDKDRTVVVFPDLLPRRQLLERVWRESRACLYSDQPERFRKPELKE
ncbi:Phosphatidylinositol N-acetylglucosaminyltransferase subunit gpi15 [Yarrowia sp. B02]|nr:Phosphatidylinositol N-acetylglucosaminyltransferase subunit gpi15 [Yarrowia sp. B02]